MAYAIDRRHMQQLGMMQRYLPPDQVNPSPVQSQPVEDVQPDAPAAEAPAPMPAPAPAPAPMPAPAPAPAPTPAPGPETPSYDPLKKDVSGPALGGLRAAAGQQAGHQEVQVAPPSAANPYLGNRTLPNVSRMLASQWRNY